MSLHYSISCLAIAALLSSSGCAFITGLTAVGGADSSAFTVNMEHYSVKQISITTDPPATSICPGSKVQVQVHAQAVELKSSKEVDLVTAANDASAAESRGKMDPIEFAMAARGGSITDGVFTADPEPFATLLGFDIKATYQFDTSKTTVMFFPPEYSCFKEVGLQAPEGSTGSRGAQGGSNGGAGSMGGPGAPGHPGPEVVAIATIVQTPLYERIGLIQASPGGGLTLFDLDSGIAVLARGGPGGRGGDGGRGGEGSQPEGAGGPGGPGGVGGSGGHGGRVLLLLDERYPELEEIIRIDVSGGAAGPGGFGGAPGTGAPPYSPCSGCTMTHQGKAGSSGPSGRSGNASGSEGHAEVRYENITEHFTELPAGIRILGNAE